MMIALTNRCKGNHGRFSIPIDAVEEATETYSNLEKTVYSATWKAILEQLVNQQLSMIQIQFFLEGDTSVLLAPIHWGEEAGPIIDKDCW